MNSYHAKGLSSSCRGRVSSFFGSKQKEENAVTPVDEGQAEINIFTVASGHLYEVRLSTILLCQSKADICNSVSPLS